MAMTASFTLLTGVTTTGTPTKRLVFGSSCVTWKNGAFRAETGTQLESITSCVPLSIRLTRMSDFPGNRSGGSFAGWARPRGCPGTFAPMAYDTARQHRPSMLAAISATSGDSPAIDHWRWSYGMTTCGGMLPGRLPAIWPPAGTRDVKYKDHAMRGRKPKPTSLKLLDGTRADRINHDEPAMPPASTEPPDWLDETARAHWGDLAPVLQSSGLLTAG